MDCIDIIEIVISLDCVINDLYDLVIIFKYIVVMMNWIVLIWLFDPSLFLLWRNEFILISEYTSDYLKIGNVADVEDGEYDWIEENRRYLWSSRFQWIVFFWWWILYKKNGYV